jgi:hypothetical protein
MYFQRAKHSKTMVSIIHEVGQGMSYDIISILSIIDFWQCHPIPIFKIIGSNFLKKTFLLLTACTGLIQICGIAIIAKEEDSRRIVELLQEAQTKEKESRKIKKKARGALMIFIGATVKSFITFAFTSDIKHY